MALSRPYIIDFSTASCIIVLLHIDIVIIILLSTKNLKNKYKAILIFAFIIRLFFMFWDLYAREIFVLPNSGADTEMYYQYAVAFSNDISRFGDLGGGFYPKILGLLFYLIGPQRIVAQYLNVLIGLCTIIVLYHTLKVLKISEYVTGYILLIATLFPNTIIMSSILLREAFISFFVAYSFYFFVRWFKNGGTLNMLLSIIFIGLGSMLHAGVSGIFLGYTFVLLFYNKGKKVYRFTLKTIIVFILLVIVCWFVYTQFSEVFLAKFNNIDDVTDIYTTANRRGGGSAYLPNMQINNFIQLLAYGPIRMLYFLIVPLPMNWRGGMDVFAFVFDSSLYLLIIIFTIRSKKKSTQMNKEKKAFISTIVVILVCVTFIFGIGVSNAGTAIRHRQKILPIFLVLLAVEIDRKQKSGELKFFLGGV